MAEENGVGTMVEAAFADDPRSAVQQLKVRLFTRCLHDEQDGENKQPSLFLSE